VTSELSFLIMESLRRKDEGARLTEEGLLDTATAPDEFRARATIEMPKWEDPAEGASGAAVPDLSPVQKANILRLLSGLREIHGYRASALLAGEGEILVHDALDAGVDLARIAPAVQGVHRAAVQAATATGLGGCEETVLRTHEAVVVLRDAPPICAVRFQLLIVLGTHGDEGPARALLKRAQPRITALVLGANEGS